MSAAFTEIRPDELRGFTQCHFFAGIGVWSYALRLAGWPDDRPVWTGSCPCPSFSAAGKGKGFADPRHLIRECQPATVFGEQVASAIGHGWLDLVYVDLEAAAYSVGAAVLGACSVGAPHIRQRLYFCAHAAGSRRQDARQHDGRQPSLPARSEQCGGVGSGPDALHAERRSLDLNRNDGRDRQDDRRPQAHGESGTHGQIRLSPDSNVRLPSHRDLQRSGEQRLLAEDLRARDVEHAEHSGSSCARAEASQDGSADDAMRSGDAGDGSNSEIGGQPVCGSASGISRHAARPSESGPPSHASRNGSTSGLSESEPGQEGITEIAEYANYRGATGGFWSNCDWWYGRDGKYRPIEPGLFPLAHGAANRVLKLRGYGDAIVPQVAAEFIRAAG